MTVLLGNEKLTDFMLIAFYILMLSLEFGDSVSVLQTRSPKTDAGVENTHSCIPVVKEQFLLNYSLDHYFLL